MLKDDFTASEELHIQKVKSNFQNAFTRRITLCIFTHFRAQMFVFLNMVTQFLFLIVTTAEMRENQQ